MNLYNLSIGELAQETGLGISTLRAWETRHGFPTPQRLGSGHRRYSERDVEALREVLRERRAGVTVESALKRARAKSMAPRSSIAATVRTALPDIAPRALSRAGMLAISRAIEDEAVAYADGGIFVGAFQHAQSFRNAQRRWLDLARTSDVTIALATFPRARNRRGLWEVPVSAAAPISREWAVICESPRFSACLVGVEQLRDGPATTARFEALWTVEPDIVREALRTATDIACAATPELAVHVHTPLQQAPVVGYDIIRSMTSLTNRVISYLQPS